MTETYYNICYVIGYNIKKTKGDERRDKGCRIFGINYICSNVVVVYMYMCKCFTLLHITINNNLLTIKVVCIVYIQITRQE